MALTSIFSAAKQEIAPYFETLIAKLSPCLLGAGTDKLLKCE